jgi:kynurenine formamidase
MKIVDLTLPIATGMTGIPKISFYDKYPVKVEAVTVVSEEQRTLLRREGVDVHADAQPVNSMNTVFTLNSHVGTHIDAPRHFFEHGASIDQTPLDRILLRDAVVIDMSHKLPGQAVTGDDLQASGAEIKAGEVAVIKTGWTDRAWGKSEFWDTPIHLEPSVGEWVEARGVAAVAMDCFPEMPFWLKQLTPEQRGANHKRWLKAGIPMIQMLTNLGAIGPRFRIVALPLKLKGMDGSPARVVGIED